MPNITAAADANDIEEIRAMRLRIESDNPPSQDEINRFLIRRAEREARMTGALHELMHQMVEGIDALRAEVKMTRNVIYGIGLGALSLWFLWTQTNFRPAGTDKPQTGQPGKP